MSEFPEPPYDLLIVGKDFRRAYRGGVLVDERTGNPLEVLGAEAPPPSAPEPRSPERPSETLLRKRRLPE